MLTDQEIFSHVDHTLLSPTATWPQIQGLCEEALRYRTASVCVPPCYVNRIHSAHTQLNICTVIGFPLGYHSAAAKLAEANEALAHGASEIDMVVDLCDVKNGDFEKVTSEIALLKQAAGERILKVIVETCYLTQEEKIMLCRCVTEGGADYIKTSTGFGTGGATLEDVALFRQHIGPGVKIKASGGIRTREDMVAYLKAGCERLGTSGAVKALCAR